MHATYSRGRAHYRHHRGAVAGHRHGDRPGHGNLSGNGGGEIQLPEPGGSYAYHAVIDEKKSFPPAQIESIAVNTECDNVTIREGSGEQITAWLHGTISATTPIIRPHLTVQQDGVLEIGVETLSTARSSSDNTQFEVVLPKQYPGKLSVDDDSGNINVGNHTFADLTLSTTAGEVTVNAVKAANFRVKITSGNLRAQRISADRVDIAAESGNIDVQSCTGATRLRCDSGNVNVAFAAPLANIDVQGTAGNIDLTLPEKQLLHPGCRHRLRHPAL